MMANMTFRNRAVAAAMACVAVTLVAAPAAAARWQSDPGAARNGYGGYYNYAPGLQQIAPSELYHSRNGTPFGPPDPATCGGYQC